MATKTATAIVNPSLIATGPGGVVPLRGKKRRLTGAELKARTDQARSVTGYDRTSPIFGLQTPDVLRIIQANVDIACTVIEAAYGAGAPEGREIEHTRVLLNELQKRIATRKLTFAR